MTQHADRLSLFEGEGEVRSLLRKLDWSRSPLGDPRAWPHALVTVVRLMLNSKFPMFVAWGPQLGFLYNDQYVAILGNKHPNALGMPFEQIWSEIWHDVGPVAAAALAGRSSYFENMPLRMLRTGRMELTYFTFSYSPVEGDHGEIEGMYCTCIESTQEVLARRRQEFQLKLSDAMRVLDSPAEVIEQASRMLGEWLGVSRVGFSEMFADEKTMMLRSEWNRDAGASLEGSVLTLDDFGQEIADLLRANGAMIVDDVTTDPRTAAYAQSYANITVRAVLALPLMRGGRLVALLYMHDNTPRAWSDEDIELARDMGERTWAAVERARAQLELRTERDRTQYIIDSMNDGFAMVAPDWTFTSVNKEGARILGCPQEELIGKDMWATFPETVGSGREELYRRVQSTRVAASLESQFRYRDGTQTWLEVRAYPSLDGGITIFYRDISDRKQAERELQESNRRKDEFLAMLAHELRNPLAPIGAAAELMEMVQLDGQRLKQTSQVISRQVRHMTGLVDDLLDVSRVTRGLVEIKRTPQDVKSIAASAVEQARPLMEARRHHLVVDLAPERAHVLGDENRLVQILANLLNNAAKYTPEGGQVRLYTEVHEKEVVLGVSDNGIGVPRALQTEIFDLFSQAERTSDRAQGGLGLGLALVRSLVELHDGRVYCVSEGEGRGSTFVVHLPRMTEVAASSGWEARKALHRAPSSLRILLVDDNEDAASMLAMVLEASGHRVTVETSSARALERASSAPFDVGVLDIGLPEMDGYELARRIRTLPGNGSMLLIAVTGYGHENDREKAAAAGFNHHFVKPVDSRKIMSVLPLR
ncbi:ATP-binding protein [Pseudoduganella sp. GCM10020061]|uniref:hybrid sensor histidine kinase/response regulator n=1 Tax=Pseudoduganella sp. GCM10020061 TaxID=3317345 RepID=UPI003639C013